jgi:HAE1 family hydrophobic/amphiphilic exporter-1
MQVVAAQADFVVDALSNLGQEIVIGGILSIAIILLFLRDWRASLAIGLMVPLSVLLALVVLQALDVTVNVLSLGGLALGVGLLVDNAIVWPKPRAESWKSSRGRHGNGRRVLTFASASTRSSRRRRKSRAADRRHAHDAARLRTDHLREGARAALFRDLSLSVVTSVGASLILALTLMPVMIVGRRRVSKRAAAKAALPQQAPDACSASATTSRSCTSAACMVAREPGEGVRRHGVARIAATVWITSRLPKEILPQVDERMVVAAMQLPRAPPSRRRSTGRPGRGRRNALGARGIYSRVGVATDEEVLSGAEAGSSATAQILVPVPAGGTRAGSPMPCAAPCRTSRPARSLSISPDNRSSAASLAARGGWCA